MEPATAQESLFRLSAPSRADVDSFHHDGYIAYADVLTDAGREGLIEETTRHFEPARRYIEAVDSGGEHPPRGLQRRVLGLRGRVSFFGQPLQ